MDFFGQRGKPSRPGQRPASIVTTTTTTARVQTSQIPTTHKKPPLARHNALPDAVKKRIERDRIAAHNATGNDANNTHTVRDSNGMQATYKQPKKRARTSSAPRERTNRFRRSPIKEDDDHSDDASDSNLEYITHKTRPIPSQSKFEYHVPREILDVPGYNPLSEEVHVDKAPTISSRALVEASGAEYELCTCSILDIANDLFWGCTDFEGLDRDTVVILEYPASEAVEEFTLLVPKEVDEYDPISDLLSAVGVMVAHYVPSDMQAEFGSLESLETSSNAGMPLKKTVDASLPVKNAGEFDHASPTPPDDEPILRAFSKARNRRNGPLFVRTLDRFNAKMRQLKKDGILAAHVQWLGQTHGVPQHVWRIIQEQVYARVVAPHVGKLKQYEAFSDHVYGEMLPPFLSEIARVANIGPSSVFVDLGSGIGNLLVQASLQTGCEAYGCEYMQIPSELATRQIMEATHRWRMWLLCGGRRLEAWHEDFTDSEHVRNVLRRADVVLVNK